jgi:hypothetical protein
MSYGEISQGKKFAMRSGLSWKGGFCAANVRLETGEIPPRLQHAHARTGAIRFVDPFGA